MLGEISQALKTAADALDALRKDEGKLAAIAKAGDLLADAFKGGGRAYSCGNGGSMCDAMHFAEELSGRFRDDRAGLPAIAISDAAHITCAGNDFGYETIFSRFVEAHARQGDVLLAISTSGSSKNVVRAATAAKQKGARVIALTGKPQSPLGALADVEICTPAATPYADRVQELHIKVIHILIELVERRLFAANYK
jgi:D-sedoheptulose 7-phosphate isomerase